MFPLPPPSIAYTTKRQLKLQFSNESLLSHITPFQKRQNVPRITPF